MDEYRLQISPIARIRNDLPEKFGIPRQSGLVPELISKVVFEPAYANPDALRGLEDFSHIWLVWGFSAVFRADEKGQGHTGPAWTPTVRPPRLGGNERKGVFATRSPFRPNPLGLSCVELKEITQDPREGPVLLVAGADLMDGTPVYDIKPYLPYTDSRPQAKGGFADPLWKRTLQVCFPEELRRLLPEGTARTAAGLLAQDPRPGYQHDPGRIYGIRFAGCDIRFRVEGELLTVTEVVPDGDSGGADRGDHARTDRLCMAEISTI